MAPSFAYPPNLLHKPTEPQWFPRPTEEVESSYVLYNCIVLLWWIDWLKFRVEILYVPLLFHFVASLILRSPTIPFFHFILLFLNESPLPPGILYGNVNQSILNEVWTPWKLRNRLIRSFYEALLKRKPLILLG